MKRREFIRASAVLGLAAPLLPRIAAAQNDRSAARARVVCAQMTLPAGKNEQAAISSALDRGIEGLLQVPARQAWQRLFSSRDVVGLKVNCLAGRGLSTHPSLVEAIVAKLLEIGLKPGQIIIWDRLNADLKRGGFAINLDAQQVRCMGNDAVGYSSRFYEAGSVCSRLSRIVTEHCTALINLPVLKDHGIVGVSAGLKNYFGAIDNPNKYHDRAGDPYVADLNRLPMLREKTRLTVCDALTAQYEGGPPYMPQWSWPLQQLFFAADMVALDSIAWQIIEQKRSQAGLPSLKEDGREPTYILTAAKSAIGIADAARIDIVNV